MAKARGSNWLSRPLASNAPAPFNDAKWKTAATAFVAERDALAASFLIDLEGVNKPLHDSLTTVQADNQTVAVCAFVRNTATNTAIAGAPVVASL